MDFFGLGVEIVDEVGFGVVGNGDDFFGFFDSVFDGKTIGETVIPASHFLAGIK